MATDSQLFQRIASATGSMSPLTISLDDICSYIVRSFWESQVAIHPCRASADDCQVVAANQISHYSILGTEGWASYNDIAGAFAERNQLRNNEARPASKTSVLPVAVVDAPVKILVRDTDSPVQAVTTWERIYPKRAWVLTVHCAFDHKMVFVVSAILNSVVGQVRYREQAKHLRLRSTDIRKSVLRRIRVPLLGYDEKAFDRAARLSYRLHCLNQASLKCTLHSEITDVYIPNHWHRLLTDLVRLYGFDETEARQLLEDVLPSVLPDAPGPQGKLFYYPVEPLGNLRLMTTADQDTYEHLKAIGKRRELSADDDTRLRAYERLLYWEARINAPIPRLLGPTKASSSLDQNAAEKAAYRYLLNQFGNRYVIAEILPEGGKGWRVLARDRNEITRSHSVREQHSSAIRPKVISLFINGPTGEVTTLGDGEPDAIHPQL